MKRNEEHEENITEFIRRNIENVTMDELESLIDFLTTIKEQRKPQASELSSELCKEDECEYYEWQEGCQLTDSEKADCCPKNKL